MLRAYQPGGGFPDLFRDIRRTQDEMNRVFGNLRLGSRTEGPLVNVWAGAEGAIVTAQVPGVSPDQINVTVHQDTVTLRGQHEPEALEKDAVVHRQERPRRPFARTIVLPFRVDADRVSARFHLGVLTLELPRPDEDKPRKIQIARA